MNQTNTEVLFIATDVENRGQLIAGIDREIETHLLDVTQDSLAQIAGVLSGRRGIASLHLISHGAPGQVLIGDVAIDRSSLDSNAAQLRTIASAMLEDGFILIYGCEVAKGAQGRGFIDELTERTGRMVGASSHKVGARDLGGDWYLDYAVSPVTNALAVPQWQGVLANQPPQFTGAIAASGLTLLGTNTASLDTDVMDMASAIAADGTRYAASMYYSDKLTVTKLVGDIWTVVGSADFTPGNAQYVGMAVAPDGTPYVLFQDMSDVGQSTVMKFDGSNWVAVGGAVSSNQSYAHKLAIAGDGSVYVEYTSSTSSEVVVKKFDGSNWNTVGSNIGNGPVADFAVAPDGTPYVVYSDSSVGMTSPVTVKQFDGSNWTVVGGEAAPNGTMPTLVFQADGKPILAYQDVADDFRLKVKAFDGSTWNTLGGAVSDMYPGASTLAVDPEGVIYAAFKDSASGKLTISQWSGSAWVSLWQGADFDTMGGNKIWLSVGSDGTLQLGWPDNLDTQDAKVATASIATLSLTATENATAISGLTITDPESDAVTLSIVGGPDAAKFQVNGNTLEFVAAPDYEAPVDANANNLYVVQLLATDAQGNQTTVLAKVAVANVNEGGGNQAPVFQGVSSSTFATAGSNSVSLGNDVKHVATAIGPDGTQYVVYDNPVDMNNSGKVSVAKLVNGTWEQVGSTEFSYGDNANRIGITVGQDGTPYVMFCDATDGYKAKVMQYTGNGASGWEQIGSALSVDAGSTSSIRLQTASDGSIYAAFTDLIDSSPTYAPKLLKLEGSSWIEVGSGLSSSSSTMSGFGISPLDQSPYVFVYEMSSGIGTLKHFDGTSWNPVGGTLSSFSDVSLAFKADGTPVLGYTDYNNGGKYFVATWDGLAWASISGVDTGIAFPAFPKIALDASDNIYLLSGSYGTSNYTLKMFDGTSWSSIGNDMGPFDSMDGGEASLLVLPNGQVSVVWPGFDTGTFQPVDAKISVGSSGSFLPLYAAENQSGVTGLTVTDSENDAVTLSIVGGVDQAKFQIVGNTLQFVSAPDYETPTDSNGNNIYEVQLQADDGNGGITSVLAKVTVANIVTESSTPTLSSASYDAGSNVLTVTAAGMTVGDSIDASKLTLTGEAGASYTLAGSYTVASTDGTTFSITLSDADAINVEGLLNYNGSNPVTGAAYNLAGAAGWDTSRATAADLTGNAVTVSNVQTPTITSSTYDASTGTLVVTGTNLVKADGATNDITANKLTVTGEGGATYTLTDSSNVEISSGNAFTIILSATDQAAINQMLNKNGTSSTGATTYNLAAADDWNTVISNGDISDTTGNGITVSNVSAPAITSSTYDASTGALVVTGTGFLKLNGVANDIVANKFTFTGEGGTTYTLTDSANVEITSGTAFTITLSATDQAAINQIINKNGTASTGATTYNLSAAEDWAAGADAAVVVADLTGNGVTASNVAVPAITSSTYDASTGALVVTGTGFLKLNGATNDIIANKFTFTGEGGATYTLTDSANVEITSGTAFTITLSATDQAAINQIINKNGTSSTSGTTYNLAAAEDWAAGADAAVVVADLAGNGVTASNVAVPAITSATYDYNSNILVVTGSGFLSKSGATNDIDLTKLTFTGEGGATYTLTNATGVEITSGTSFSATLSGADLTNVEALLNKDGTTAVSATTYNLSAEASWDRGDATNGSDTSNAITVSNYAAPTLTSATYDASTNVLTVTGTNLVSKSGASNDVVVSKLTLTGEGGTYTLTSADVEITDATTFSLTLNAADQLEVRGLLNKNGTSSSGATTYNLAAAEDWMAGTAATTVVADLTGNGITVSNVQTPTITSATYDSDTGVLTVTGTNLFSKVGANNDIDLTKLTFTGQGAATYTLTNATGVEITSATSFTVTLTGADKTNVDALLNQIGTSAVDATTYNLAAANNWLAGADAAATITDATNAVTVSIAPKITSATYDAATGSLVVTGTNMQAKAGVANDITANKLTLTGEGGASYTLTDTANVELTSATSFTLSLSATDKAAINQIVNKNGTSSTGATTYNLAVADDWNAQVTAGDTSDLTGNGVTASNVAVPAITSSTYDATTGTLVVTGTGFTKLDGATNDIIANKFTFTGEGGATYTLTDSANVEITSGTAFTITLSATDQAAINQIVNKNGTASTGATTYNLAAAEDWAAGADAAVVVADLTGNGVTASNVAVPAITSSTYDATTGALVVTGTGFSKLNGATNDIVANKFTFTGEGGATYTLTDSANVEITSGTTFTITLSATDQAAINQIINKNGTASTGATTYNLAAAEDWAAGAATAVVVADLTGNGVTASNVAAPAITSSTYDASTGALVVTGTGFLKLNGSANDIVANKFTFTGEGGTTYTLTDSSNVEITSGTAFTITLSATDQAAINQIVNKNGTSSTGATTYNLAAAEDWAAGADAAVVVADLTGNGVTASNIAVPAITSATYDASTGALVVTGTGFVKLSGATNDIVANKFTFTGEGGATYTLTDSANVEITSGTAFTITLSATDKAAINQIINKNGTSSTGATTYNLAAAEDWTAGAAAGVTDADLTGNGITVSNVAVPTITSATYVNNTGVLVVTGSNFLKLVGANNDIDASKLTFTGQGGATYTLTGTAGVEITSASEFTLTLTGADKAGVNALFTKTGLSANDSTVYNLAAAEDWAAGADAAVVVADLTGNGISVTANIVPTSSNGEVTTDEDTAYSFDVTAFPFSDGDNGDSLQTVKISALPANGTLTLNATVVTLDQEIALADLIAGNLKFTPEANANGDAYTTFQFQVGDGNGYSVDYSMTVNVTAVNDAPVISSGSEATVEENIDPSTVVYTATASDVDNGQALTYSLSGTDAAHFSIDADTGEVRFVNSPDYETQSSYSINVVATDNGPGSLFDSQAVTITITDVYEPPVDDDHDGQIDTVEDGVTVIPSNNGAVVGDGNGDGIADNLQTAVTSALILNTPTISNPGDAQPIYVTLVANSVDGKVGAGETAQISAFQQLDAPIDLPAKANMPLGLFAFTATTAAAGSSENFSLYVDSSVKVNGYWKQNADGHWVNLASAKYGGQVVSESGKTRLDFTIQDGGQFDSDGLANGIISDPGAAAFLPRVGRVILGDNKKNLLLGSDDSDDLIIGYRAKDVLIGGSGDDWMVGGGGADTYSYSSTALGSGDLSAGDMDTIVDGGGRIRFSAEVLSSLKLDGQSLSNLTGKHTLGQQIDSNNSLALNNNLLQIDLNGDGSFNVADDFQIDFYARTTSKLLFNAKTDLLTLTSKGVPLAAPVTGTEDFDTLVGDSHRNTLTGLAGDDLMYGAGGKDLLIGGTGDDVMVGGTGIDRYQWATADITADGIDQVIDGKRSKLSFDGALLEQLKIDGQTLADITTKKVVLGNQIDADNSIAYHNGVVEIDVNGDGQFLAADDFQIQLVGSISKVTFVAASDLLILG